MMLGSTLKIQSIAPYKIFKTKPKNELTLMFVKALIEPILNLNHRLNVS